MKIRRVAVVTGSRAEFGLLEPVMRAVERHPELELLVIAAGSHLVPPALTFRDVKAAFAVADSVPMQVAGRRSRPDDAEALGRGIARFVRSFTSLAPDWVVVLGDRIEALAAASAASVGGWSVAHLHGGDRAEGVADDSMRHAITKLSHLHLAATSDSAVRLLRLGEPAWRVRVVGSPAIDALASIGPLDDRADAALGAPQAVFLMHPVGRSDEHEEAAATAALEGLRAALGAGERVLALAPNLDAGRAGIARALDEAAGASTELIIIEHLPRARFIGLLRRVAQRRGVLVGNSSASLIEAAALGLGVVDVGPRQRGRVAPKNVIRCGETAREVEQAVRRARELDVSGLKHPYGDGLAGERAAAALAEVDPHAPAVRRKLCAY